MFLSRQQRLLSLMDKQGWRRPFLMGCVSLILLLALYPYGVLAEESRFFHFVVYRIFDSELSHLIGHFILFGFIGTAVLLFFPKLLSTPILYLSVMLNFAWVQEFLQLATFKRRPINIGELKDLGVDLTAAVFAFCIIYCGKKLKERIGVS